MNCGRIFLMLYIFIVIESVNSANECTQPNTSCYARDVCALLGGVVRGTCFKGVCCDKTYSRSKTCDTKKILMCTRASLPDQS
uniref:Carboxypeptidase inhibitor n=1 Tax=Rhipicephalus zambeziensis TaxID=60191 RepID=A0A224Y2Q7_9ACAR